ncbi:hypothetical protein IWW38_002592 [Coemansia aciculifera]|uniref:Uncharacterized protein n=1 Tax=Coemansia aciculifera TaxID=417176 RepID=A0ACC1M313_9FUNG|nr:hypothetical protein IWW38_002592 [Coemansia aciculifera]
MGTHLESKKPFTGSPLYTSARLLLGSLERSIYDDLESLLYVFLDAFSTRPRTGASSNQPPGFTFYDNVSMASSRLTFMQSGECYLGLFGVVLNSTSVPANELNAMRRFLFFDDGIHIGARVLETSDFPRTFDFAAATEFLGKGAARKLQALVSGQTTPPASPAAPRDKQKRKRTRLSVTPPSVPVISSPSPRASNSNPGHRSRFSSTGSSAQTSVDPISTQPHPRQPTARKTILSTSTSVAAANRPIHQVSRIPKPPVASSRNARIPAKPAKAMGSNLAKTSIANPSTSRTKLNSAPGSSNSPNNHIKDKDN